MKATEIATFLPEVYQQTLDDAGPLDAILGVMEQLHAPAEEALEKLDVAFDPRRTPDRFVSFLAGWVDLDRMFAAGTDQRKSPVGARLLGSGLGRLRELVAEAAFLSQWRGTRRGLLRFLEVATGVQGFTIEEQVADADGEVLPFHVLFRAPAAAERQKPLVVWIIESEKPAYVTYELHFLQEEDE